MAMKAVQHGTVSAKLIERWQQVCRKLTALAEEIPENRFDYRPVEGVRTFADVLRHVAFWNQYVADSARERKGDDAVNELPKEGFSTKTQIVDALTRCAADAADALKDNPSGLSPEMAENRRHLYRTQLQTLRPASCVCPVEPSLSAGIAWTTG